MNDTFSRDASGAGGGPVAFEWCRAELASIGVLGLLLLAAYCGGTLLSPAAAWAQDASHSRAPALRPIGVGFVRHAIGAWAGRIADGGFVTATGRNLRWMPHDTDSAVAAAFAAGKLDIAMMGASVAVSAAMRGIDLRIFYVAGSSSTSEGLVMSGLRGAPATEPKALQGKVIATPFGSTPHFRFLESIKRWGFSATSMRIVNLQTSQIAEAWQRGELDGAIVSEPLLSQLGRRGQPIDLPDLNSQAGLLVLVVASDFAASHNVFLSRFVDVMARAEEARVVKPPTREEAAHQMQSISFITGLSAQAVGDAMERYRPPALAEQASPVWLGGGIKSGLVGVLKASAEIWRWSGRVPGRDPEFAAMLAPEAVQLALTYR